MREKIKLVVSDLHLCSGVRLPGGSKNPLEEFFFDRLFSEFLSFHTTGPYVNMEVELILNGDIFDFLQVDHNGHYITMLTEKIELKKLERIVKGHSIFFNALNKFAQKPHCSITYIVGNHDQSMMWPKLRDYLGEVIGASVKYVDISYFFDGIHIEHGHMYEALNRISPKKFFIKKNIPTPILNLPIGSVFFVDYVLPLKHNNFSIDKVRPFKRMFLWSLFNNPKFIFWNLILLVRWITKLIFTTWPKAFSLGKTLRNFLITQVFPSLLETAKKLLEDEKINTVIFGHSHIYEYNQVAPNKEYFNTGTWTELTSLDFASLGRITKLVYVLLEEKEEGGFRGQLKEWKGYNKVEADLLL